MKINFNFTQTDKRKGFPYAAKLVWDTAEGKITRKFFELSRIYGKKEVTVSGDFEAEVGDIIEQREGGSWKNDYRYWYIVRKDGLEKVADIANSQEKLKVTKYLKGECEL